MAFGHAAVLAGYRVRYFCAAEPVDTLHRGLADNSVGRVIEGIRGPTPSSFTYADTATMPSLRSRCNGTLCRGWTSGPTRLWAGRHSYRASKDARSESGGW